MGDYVASVVAGCTASATITPIMTILDLSIIRSQFAKISFGKAIKATVGDLFGGKARWNPAAGIMWGVYASTFVTANTTRALCRDTGTDPTLWVAGSTSLVNSVTIAMKDKAFATLYTGGAKKFPLSSLILFGLRDGLTISATFVIKDQIRDYMVDDLKLDPLVSDLSTAFGVPMFMQVFSTPFHVLALDRYERPDATFQSRMSLVVRNFRSVTMGRVVRIVPAFGLGGFLNDSIREVVDDYLEVPYEIPEEEGKPRPLLRRRTTIV